MITRMGIINGVVALVLLDSIIYMKSSIGAYAARHVSIIPTDRVELVRLGLFILALVVICVVFLAIRKMWRSGIQPGRAAAMMRCPCRYG